MIEAQQGLTYADQLAIARRAEGAGFDIIELSCHEDYRGGSNPDWLEVYFRR